MMKAENGVAEEKVEHSLLVVEKRKLEENKRHVNLF